MSQNAKLKANAEEQVTRLLTQLADLEAGANGVRSGYHRFFFFSSPTKRPSIRWITHSTTTQGVRVTAVYV